MKQYILSIALFLCIVFIFSTGLNSMANTADGEGAKTLETAVNRACVQCYAIEGRYPPSVAYLEEHYGIQVDESKYIIHYSGFASNVMPDISVIKKT